MPYTIGILQAGRTPDHLVARHGDYPDMIQRWLDDHRGGLAYRMYRSFAGELPGNLDSCDAWLITGSRVSVLDSHTWINKLMELVREAITEHRTVVGICFGHQLVAEALGGKVSKSSIGWTIGRQTYVLDAAADTNATLRLNAIHRDQVVTPPTTATVVASSPSCPYAALAYGSSAITLQAHPEFEDEFLGALIASRLRSSLSEREISYAIATLTAPADSDRAAHIVFSRLWI